MSVNIGDTQNLVALVTNNPSKDDITFTVENQQMQQELFQLRL